MAKQLGRYYCRDCNAEIGSARDEWHKLDDGHFAYNASMYYFGVVVQGRRQKGQEAWEILNGCWVQQLVCRGVGCASELGFKCVATTGKQRRYRQVNISYQTLIPLGRWNYRQCKGKMIDLKSHLKNDPDTEDTDALFTTAPQTSALPSGSVSASPAPENPNDVQPQAAAGTTDITHHEDPATPLDAGTADTLSQQRKDIDRIAANVDKLLQEMESVKANIGYLKFQQQTFAEHDAAGSPTALAEDIGALADNVARISAKVKDVDGIKDDLKMIKDRVQHLEETIQSGQLQPNGACSEPESNNSNNMQEIPSSTRSHTEQPLAHSSLGSPLRLSQEDGPADELVDSLRRSQSQQILASQMSLDEVTPRKDRIRPQITSAEKVAAQKRPHSSSSSSSGGTPPPINHSKIPRITGKPDWSTKPNAKFAHKGKLTSLNDHHQIVTSDPEDSDFDPNSQPQLSDMIGARETSSKARSKAPVRLPTPEWEKSDWEGPAQTTTRSARGENVVRRGMSGRHSLPNRDALRRRNSGYESRVSGDDTNSATKDPQIWANFSDVYQRYASTPTEAPKMRDSQGRLLRPNGKVDGRSLRHQKERAAIAQLKAHQKQVEKKGHHELAREAREKLATFDGRQKQALGVTTLTTSPTTFVDPAALAAAGYVSPYSNTATPSHGDTPVEHGIANEGASTNETDQQGNDIPPFNGGHDKLMKQIFPWR
ncbi:MAG: hypothetical protein Q9218_007464 [Villophora microphyllina]